MIAAVIVALGLFAGLSGSRSVVASALVVLAVVSILLGMVFSIRIGGADMPVLISFLNATAGLAAALCGLVIQNRLLIACGATVAASGSILTHVMCAGMNRGLLSVFTGIQPTRASLGFPVSAPGTAEAAIASREEETISTPAQPCGAVEQDPEAQGLAVVRAAQRIIIIPGYGMALAEAQFEVARLAEWLVEQGRSVRFGVHPLAGRMPGHMHVLLAEAEVDYERLCDLKDVNDDFRETDLAIVVGACDVVNPAAMEAADTLISGMPILRAHEARHVVVCNLDDKPGYSGVPNLLYQDPKAILLFGDAKATVRRLLDRLMC